jgi:hypothetical protein
MASRSASITRTASQVILATMVTEVFFANQIQTVDKENLRYRSVLALDRHLYSISILLAGFT